MSGAFENLLTVTLGITPVSDAAAGGDPTLRELPASVVRAVAAELTTAEHGDPTDPIDTEAAEAMRAMDEFDRRLATGAAEKAAGIATAPERKGGPAGPIDAAITAQPVRRKAPIGVTGLSWSPDAPELLREVEVERSRAGGAALHKFTSRGFLYGRFATLKLVNMRLASIDNRSRSLHGLRELNVSGNRLTALRHLPAKLESLQAFGNCIVAVDQEVPLTSCVHLGLGYNELATCSGIPEAFPGLASLDLSWNRLASLAEVTRTLAPLAGSLRRLELHGNPLCLSRDYRRAVCTALAPPAGALELLDGLPAESAPSPRATPTATPRASDDVTILVRLVKVSGVPLPVDVPGWREARDELEAEAAAAAALASKAKGRAKPKKGEPAPVDDEPAAPPAPACWRLRISALPREVGDGLSALPSPLQQLSALGQGETEGRAIDLATTAVEGAAPLSAGEAGSSDASDSDHSCPPLDAALGGDVPGPAIRLSGAASWQLRDAIAVNGLDVTLIASRPAPDTAQPGPGPREESSAASDAAATPAASHEAASASTDSVLLGRALVSASDLLGVADTSDPAKVVSRASLKLEQLPPSTTAAAVEAAESELRRELAEEAADAAGGGKKKPAKGKAEAPPPLTLEQRAEAASRAAAACKALCRAASVTVEIELRLVE